MFLGSVLPAKHGIEIEDSHFKSLMDRLFLCQLDPLWKGGPLPFDYYCPSLQHSAKDGKSTSMEKRICPKCNRYEPSQEMLKKANHVCGKAQEPFVNPVKIRVCEAACPVLSGPDITQLSMTISALKKNITPYDFDFTDLVQQALINF